jgi:hypothetical protein
MTKYLVQTVWSEKSMVQNVHNPLEIWSEMTKYLVQSVWSQNSMVRNVHNPLQNTQVVRLKQNLRKREQSYRDST